MGFNGGRLTKGHKEFWGSDGLLDLDHGGGYMSTVFVKAYRTIY